MCWKYFIVKEAIKAKILLLMRKISLGINISHYTLSEIKINLSVPEVVFIDSTFQFEVGFMSGDDGT